MFKEFKQVQNFLNFAYKELKDFPCTDQGGFFSRINIGYKLNKNLLFSSNEDRYTTLDFWLLPVILIPKLSTSNHSLDIPKSCVATSRKFLCSDGRAQR